MNKTHLKPQNRINTYVRPEIKYSSVACTSAPLLASEKVVNADEEAEEAAEELTIFDEMNVYKKATHQSVWEE